MQGITHAAVGAVIGATVVQNEPIVGGLLGGVIALLPDIDNPRSMVGKKVKPASYVIFKTAGHRTYTHTIWFAMAVTVVSKFLAPIIGMNIENMMLLTFSSIISHLVLDSLTKHGVNWLKPLSFNIRGPITTGSIIEKFIIGVSVVILFMQILPGIDCKQITEGLTEMVKNYEGNAVDIADNVVPDQIVNTLSPYIR